MAMNPTRAGRDQRLVELLGKEPVHPSDDGHVRIDCTCPYCDREKSLWLHFAASGHGNFVCRPCGAIGLASYEQEGDGKRIVTLDLQGQVEDESWD